jgi:hypothetical protein
MAMLKSFVVCVALLLRYGLAAAIPEYFRPQPYTRPNLSAAQVRAELATQVSNSTLIYGSDDARYPNATARWNNFAVPNISVVIVPGEERDVSTIVRVMKLARMNQADL